MSFAEYVGHGWVLTPIPPGQKSPVQRGWQHLAAGVTDPLVADELTSAGLMHAYSGTCALDIDDWAAAEDWCLMQGIDLEALWNAPDAVRIVSGRPNSGKLLYKLVLPLVSHQVTRKVDGKAHAIIDFRCGTRGDLTKQDVLPPSMHPNGQRYAWGGAGHWSRLPVLPEEVRTAWASLLTAAAPERSRLASPSGVDADAIRTVLATKNPDCGMNDWVKILAIIHHETQGADWGLALADEWSSKATGTCDDGTPKYKGFDDLQTRWRSFRLDHPNPATFAGIAHPMATEDDFPAVLDVDETAVDATPLTAPENMTAVAAQAAEADEEQQIKTRKAAEDLLVKSLVYVRSADMYYDIEQHYMLPTDHAIQHTWSPRMPRVPTMAGTPAVLNPVEVLKMSRKKTIVHAPAFHPGQPQFFEHEGERYVNEYRGGLADPLVPTAEERQTILDLFGRIPDAVFRTWLLQFYAFAVQRPGTKIRAMPIIWSHQQGNGKSTLLQAVPKLLFTERYCTAISNTKLEENYNGYLVGKWFGHFTELHTSMKGDRSKIMNKIKPWITDDTLPINVKYGAAYDTANFMLYTAASNHEDCAEIVATDRRFAVTSMNSVQPMSPAEIKRYYLDFLNVERAAGVLRHFFLNHPVGDFNPDVGPPVTAAKLEMARHTMAPEVQVILEAIEDHSDVFAKDVVSNDQVLAFVRRALPRSNVTPQKLGMHTDMAPLNFMKRRVNVEDADGRRKMGLNICRDQAMYEDLTDQQLVALWRADAENLTV